MKTRVCGVVCGALADRRHARGVLAPARFQLR